MDKEFSYPASVLLNHIVNTIKVYDDYRLDKTKYVNHTYKILSDVKGRFIQYQVFDIPTGSKLKLFAGNMKGPKIDEQSALLEANDFLARLDGIVSGRIALTPDVVNKSAYKEVGIAATIQLVRLVVAIAVIAFALYVLLK